MMANTMVCLQIHRQLFSCGIRTMLEKPDLMLRMDLRLGMSSLIGLISLQKKMLKAILFRQDGVEKVIGVKSCLS